MKFAFVLFTSIFALLISLPSAFSEEVHPGWIRDLHLNLVLNQGTTETLDLNAGLAGNYQSETNKITSSLAYSFGEATGRNSEGAKTETTTKDRTEAETQINHLLSRRTYALLGLTALKDRIADVQYRAFLGPGVGYYFVREEGRLFSTEAGMAYLIEKVSENADDYLLFRIAQRFEHKLNDHAEIWQSLEYLPEAENFENYLLNAEAGITAKVNGNLGLRMVLQNRYDNMPAETSNRNDLRVTAGVTYRF